MLTADWLRQAINFILSFKEIEDSFDTESLCKNCLLALQSFSLADEVFWIKKEDFITSSVISSVHDNAFQDYVDSALISFLFEISYARIINNNHLVNCIEDVVGNAVHFVAIPVHNSNYEACYLLAYHQACNFNSDYLDFIKMTQQRLEELHASYYTQLDFEKLKLKFNGILKSIPQSILFIDDKGEYCWLNENAAELLRLPAGNVCPDTIHVAMSKFRSKATNTHDIEEKARQVFNGIPVTNWHWIFAEPSLKVLDVQYSPVASSNMSGIFWVFADVTRQYEYERHLTNSKK